MRNKHRLALVAAMLVLAACAGSGGNEDPGQEGSKQKTGQDNRETLDGGSAPDGSGGCEPPLDGGGSPDSGSGPWDGGGGPWDGGGGPWPPKDGGGGPWDGGGGPWDGGGGPHDGGSGPWDGGGGPWPPNDGGSSPIDGGVEPGDGGFPCELTGRGCPIDAGYPEEPIPYPNPRPQ